MSKDYCGFSNEDGETAFLAGVVDVLSDNLSMILDNTNALDADIFLVVDNNISLLNDAVKKRLHAYIDKYECSSIITDEKIDAIDIHLIPQNSKRIFHSKEGTNPAVTATK